MNCLICNAESDSARVVCPACTLEARRRRRAIKRREERRAASGLPPPKPIRCDVCSEMVPVPVVPAKGPQPKRHKGCQDARRAIRSKERVRERAPEDLARFREAYRERQRTAALNARAAVPLDGAAWEKFEAACAVRRAEMRGIGMFRGMP